MDQRRRNLQRTADHVFEDPPHPYTKALLNTLPKPDFGATHELAVLEGNVPSATNPPSGCRFHEQCPLAEPVCSQQEPALRTVRGDRPVACHLVEGD